MTRLFKSLLVGVSATDGGQLRRHDLLLVLVAWRRPTFPRGARPVDPLLALRNE